MIVTIPPDSAKITALMDDLRPLLFKAKGRIATDLPFLLDALRQIPFIRHSVSTPDQPSIPLLTYLSNFFAELRAPFEAVTVSGVLCDPWAAAKLRRDEVRNASVLSSFLDPRGGLSRGGALLTELLTQVDSALSSDFPTCSSPSCLVSVERCPDGDSANRVDIQVDDPNFFLVIEVKIDASEQPQQIARYCDVAAKRTAGRRPWAVVFLTVDGRSSVTAGDYDDHVVAISWKQIAAALRRTVRGTSSVPRFLATSFATHISNL